MIDALHSLAKRLLSNFWLKLGSLILAVMIWIAVSSQGRTDKTFMHVPYELRNIPLNLEVVERGISFVQVTVRGPQNLLSSLTPENIIIPIEIPDEVNPGDISLTINPGAIQLPYKNQISILQVSPSDILIRLEETTLKTVSIQPLLKGIPAPGYELAGWEVTPEKAEIKGPEEILGAISRILTEPIDIASVNLTFNQRVRLEVPGNLVQITSPGRATVTVRIQEKIIERTFPEIEVTLLLPEPDPGIIIDPSITTITLKGPELVIATLQHKDVAVVADCRDLTPGMHEIPLSLANTPARISTFVTDPLAVTVTVPESPGTDVEPGERTR
ncbi:YbbR-like domain-containing protein [bacterium]|nr:YbbR-like domain-containing protein [candidate division CSSED10-310 bacterium]